MATAPRSTQGFRFFTQTRAPLAFPAPAPQLPVLLSTTLALELLAGAPAIALSEVTSVLLRDPFAILALFRRAGEECGEEFERVEDCLASLPREAWPGMMPAPPARAADRAFQAKLGAFADHARRVAERCRSLAWAGALPCAEDLDCEQAYLAGLLHEAAAVPSLLGWRRSPAYLPHTSISLNGWSLPPFFREYLENPRGAEPWSSLVEAAHRELLEEALISA